jgi:hypothetical protein
LQELGALRETRKDRFMVLFTLASAIAVLAYAVVSGDKPIYVLLLGGIGFIAGRCNYGRSRLSRTT